MNSELELKLGARIVTKYINAILNYTAHNPKIYDPQILTLLQNLEQDNLLSGPTTKRNSSLYALVQKNSIKGFVPLANGSEIIYGSLLKNLGFKKILKVLDSACGDARNRISTTYNCGQSLVLDTNILNTIAACINQSSSSNLSDFNDNVYMSALKFLNELNYEEKTADEAEALEAVLNEVHAEIMDLISSASSGSATAHKK